MRQTRDLTDVPHFVYRVFDATGRLLYVGCAVDVERRMEQHSGQWWRWYVAEVTWTGYPTRAAGRTAEAEAIVAERPVCNARRPGLPFAESYRLQREYLADVAA